MGVPQAERRIHRLDPRELPPGSYERFAQAEFYVRIDQELLQRAPVVNRVLDAATGTAVTIEHLHSMGKLRSPFSVVGVDIDPISLETARRKFSDFAPTQGISAYKPVDTIFFIQSPIESIPQIPNDSQQLVTFFNSIHLTNVPDALREIHRVLEPNAPLLVNTAYEATSVPKGAARFLGLLIINGRKNARAMGFKGEFESPLDLCKYSMDDYIRLASDAGFVDVQAEMRDVNMGVKDWEDICDYIDFAQGAMPGVPIDIARETLVKAVAPTLERMKIDSVPRRWMYLEARKGRRTVVFDASVNGPLAA